MLPKVISNTYHGHKLALYAFYAITLVTIARSLIHMLSPDGGAQSIATIPLDHFSSNAAATIVLLFAYWGLSQFIISCFYVLISVYYRSLIPLMYCFLCFEYCMRIILAHWKPIHTISTAPGAIGNYVMVPLTLILFVLSIKKLTNPFQHAHPWKA